MTRSISDNCSTTAVLLYHRMGWPKPWSLVAGQYVAPRLFRAQLKFLADRGWQCFSLTDSPRNGEDAGRRLCITFDDGYRSVYEHAVPALSEAGASATIYVVADTIGGINEWDRRHGDSEEPMMTAAQLRELADLGFIIGSHTLTHPHLPQLYDAHLHRELRDSRSKLEDIIGRPVMAFSYPYGDFDDRVLQAVMDAGYTSATSTRLGVVTAKTDRFAIPRVNVRWNALGRLLLRKIHRAQRASGVLR